MISRFLIFIFVSMCFLIGDVSAQRRTQTTRADTHAVMGQFMGIVASGLALVASSSDKEAQLQALAHIAQGVANIIELSRNSGELASECIKELNMYQKSFTLARARKSA